MDDLPPDPNKWTGPQVLTWCRSVLMQRFPPQKCSELLAEIEKHLLDGPLLLEMAPDDWKELVPYLGPRKVLMKEFHGVSGVLDSGMAPRAATAHQLRVHLQRVQSLRSLRRQSNANSLAAFGRQAAQPKTEVDAESLPDSPSAAQMIAARMPRQMASRDSRRGSLFPHATDGPGRRGSIASTVLSARPRNITAPMRRRVSSTPSLYDVPDEADEVHSARPSTGTPPAKVKRSKQKYAPRKWSTTSSMESGDVDDSVPSVVVSRESTASLTSASEVTVFRPPEADDMPQRPGAGSPKWAQRRGDVDDVPGAGPDMLVPLRDGGSRSPSVKEMLAHNRAGEAKETFVMMPRDEDAANPPRARAATPSLYAAMMRQSALSHLPIIEYHYNWHSLLAERHWYERIAVHLCHLWCRLVMFLNCLRNMMTVVALLWCTAYVGLVLALARAGLTIPFQGPFSSASIYVNVLIFPLAFSVNAAYGRREGALALFASFKGCCLSLYLSHRCWQFEDGIPGDFVQCSQVAISALFSSVQGYLTAKTEAEKVDQLQVVYDTVSELTLVNDICRLAEIPTPLCARLHSDLWNLIGSFERLRTFSDYRTPSTIRSFIHLNIFMVPVMLAPFFAEMATQSAYAWFAFPASFLLPLPFLLLSNVQSGLENPFRSSRFQADSIRLDSLQMLAYIQEEDKAPEAPEK